MKRCLILALLLTTKVISPMAMSVCVKGGLLTALGSLQFNFTGVLIGKIIKKKFDKPLSNEFDQKVRSILREIQFANSDDIPLKNFDSQNLKLCPAFATKDTIYLDEKELSTYSDDEIRFLVGHEATHLTNKDFKNRIYFSAVVPTIIYGTLLTVSNLVYKLNNDGSLLDSDVTSKNHETVATSLGVSALLSGALGWLKLSRNQEYCADEESVKRLNCSNGAIAWLKRWQDKHPDWLPYWLSTHPRTSDRINNVLKLIEKND